MARRRLLPGQHVRACYKACCSSSRQGGDWRESGRRRLAGLLGGAAMVVCPTTTSQLSAWEIETHQGLGHRPRRRTRDDDRRSYSAVAAIGDNSHTRDDRPNAQCRPSVVVSRLPRFFELLLHIHLTIYCGPSRPPVCPSGGPRVPLFHHHPTYCLMHQNAPPHRSRLGQRYMHKAAAVRARPPPPHSRVGMRRAGPPQTSTVVVVLGVVAALAMVSSWSCRCTRAR